MWLVLFFGIIFLGISMTTVRINLFNIEIDKNIIDYKIKVNIKFFDFLNIFSITFYTDYFKIFYKKFYYKNMKNKEIIKGVKENLLNIILKRIKGFSSLIKLKVKKANFSLRVGTENVFFTSFLVVFISTIITGIIFNQKNKINTKNVKYKILPDFNRNKIDFKGNIIVSLNLKKFILLFYKNRKEKKAHNIVKRYA